MDWIPSPNVLLAWPGNTYVLCLQTLVLATALLLAISLLYRRFISKVEVVKKIMGLKGPRFRKRDKMLFYTKRLWRNMNTLTALQGGKRLKKRQVVLRIAKRILFPKREQPQLRVKGPSQAFLEEDNSDQRQAELPSDVIYLIRSIRLFGFLEKPLYTELYKLIETCDIEKDDLLFQVGDEDDSIYTVISGSISVYVQEKEEEYILKEAKAGDSISSFLSALVVLSNRESCFKTVSARAREKSKVVRLRYRKFHDLLKIHPMSMLRLVQNVVIRLQRVDFSALHEYLGLTDQMMRGHLERSKSFPLKMSPVKNSASMAVSRKISHQPSHFTAIPTTPTRSSEAQVESTGRSNAPTETSKDQPNAPPLEHPPARRISRQHSVAARRASVIGTAESHTVEISDEDCLEQAMRAFVKNLGLANEDKLRDKLTVCNFNVDDKITTQDDKTHVNHLYYISFGIVETRHSTSKVLETSDVIFVSHPGDIIGLFETLTSDAPFITRLAKTRVKAVALESEEVYKILNLEPSASLTLALSLIERLSPFLRQIDFAMDWNQVESGKAVYHQGDASDAMYVVLSGRLRAVANENNTKRLVGEYGRDDLVGFVEVLTETPRTSTMMAVRDTELAKIPAGLVNFIKIKYPSVVSRLIQIIGRQYMASMNDKFRPQIDAPMNRKLQSNLSTIAILPVSDDVPLRAFTLELNHALAGQSFCVNSTSIKKELGPNALESINEYRLCTFLGQLEERHKIILYECDKEFTAWTQRCVRQADCILIVALGGRDPQLGRLEIQVENIAKRTQKELVLLHQENGPPPQNTVEWLNIRSWCSSHHHLLCPPRVFRSEASLKGIYQSLRPAASNDPSHFSRLARFLTGTSIGLVLGGGGARGCAHVGMVRAILEAGIPIDMVGGVSIGAFMSALYAQELNLTTMTQKARDWAYGSVACINLCDLTWPTTSYFSGKAFNRGIQSVFGEKSIEDLWLPYFTVTTDISSSSPRVHRHGSLWSYVRSSMSLASVLPPLCDPVDGHLLLDGGYVNNLPADVMYREMGAETILAVDVGSEDETDLMVYGDSLSGFWLLWRSLIRNPPKVLNSAEIQTRLTYVSCVRQLEEVKASDYCVYIRPPINKYKTLQFPSFNEICEVGYQHGKTFFASKKSCSPDGRFSSLVVAEELRGDSSNSNDTEQSSDSPRAKTVTRPFGDLASKACEIIRPLKEFTMDDEEESLSDNFIDENSEEED